jgi:hypothetical protein
METRFSSGGGLGKGGAGHEKKKKWVTPVARKKKWATSVTRRRKGRRQRRGRRGAVGREEEELAERQMRRGAAAVGHGGGPGADLHKGVQMNPPKFAKTVKILKISPYMHPSNLNTMHPQGKCTPSNLL